MGPPLVVQLGLPCPLWPHNHQHREHAVPQIAMEPLETLCADVLAGAGMRADDAAMVARHLVDAEVKGVVSHGFRRLTRTVLLASLRSAMITV